MNSRNETYAVYEDDGGEEYYCPIGTVKDDRYVSEWEIDNCVEVSTAGRYSGNLNVVDRFGQ